MGRKTAASLGAADLGVGRYVLDNEVPARSRCPMNR